MRRLSISLLFCFCVTVAAPAQSRPPHGAFANLQICNHGKVTVDVYVAKQWGNLRSTGWEVRSSRVLSGKCATVYSSSLTVYSDDPGYLAEPAYIGFAFTDAHGQWGGGQFTQVPDIGVVHYGPLVAAAKGSSGHPLLVSANNKRMCVRKGATSYHINNDLETDCATFRVTDADRGEWVPLVAAFLYRPIFHDCPDIRNDVTPCTLPSDYLTIAAVPKSRIMAGQRGNGSDKEGHSESGVREADATRQLQEYDREQRAQEAGGRRQAYKDDQDENLQVIRERAAAGDLFAQQALEAWQREQQKQASSKHESVAAYSEQWRGRYVVIGTVARITVDRSRFPQWLTLYFRESPKGAFVVCSPYPDIFAENFGPDYKSDLIGKKVEVEGIVEGAMCAQNQGSISVTTAGQIRPVEK